MNRKIRSARRYGLGALAVFVLTFGYLFAQVFNLSGDVETNGATADQALTAASQAQLQAQGAVDAAKEANRRLIAAGKAPVPVPTLTTPPPPQTDEFTPDEELAVHTIVASAIRTYQPTLTASQVEQIARVAAPKVVRPKDGRTPTAAELQPLVKSSVASYCTEDRCVGKTGAAGKDAPPVSDERLSTMIDQALTSYCAQRNDCKGADGADSTVPGPTGPTGPQGATGDQGPAGPDSSAAKCAAMTGELQELTVTTTDPLTQVKILVCVLK